METISQPTSIADDVVVRLDYTLTVEGQVVDSSDESEPIEFIQGYGQIIPGLERELYGMKVAEAKTVKVAAADAYGELDPEALVEFPRTEFPQDIPVELGTELQVRDDDGNILMARITDFSDDTVQLDFNHPLAGKDLTFDVKVVELRVATEEEKAHGHAHSHGDEGDEEDEE